MPIPPIDSKKATVEFINDGDTFRCRLDLGLNIITTVRVRFLGINAPDLNTIVGQKARAFVVDAIEDAAEVRVMTDTQDKYGRWLGTIYYRQGEEWYCLNDQLLTAGLAVPYP